MPLIVSAQLGFCFDRTCHFCSTILRNKRNKRNPCLFLKKFACFASFSFVKQTKKMFRTFAKQTKFCFVVSGNKQTFAYLVSRNNFINKVKLHKAREQSRATVRKISEFHINMSSLYRFSLQKWVQGGRGE